MWRVLDEEDFHFIHRQPGFTPEMATKLRIQRCPIFRAHLRSMDAEFKRICMAIKGILLHSKGLPQNNIYYMKCFVDARCMDATSTKQDTNLFRKVLITLNEAQRRWLVGREALRRGRGGIQRMVEESGLSKPTILKGIRELRGNRKLTGEEGRVRKPGGGRNRSRTTIRKSPGCWNR